MNDSSKNSKPKGLTVLVPLYQPPKPVESLVERVVPELPQNSELLLCWDGPALSKPKHPSVRIFSAGERSGIANTLNRGVRLARNESIVFLDQDDELTPHSLQVRLSALGNRRALIGKVGAVLDASGSPIPQLTNKLKPLPAELSSDYFRRDGWIPMCPLGTGIFAKSLLLEFPFDSRLSTAFDVDFLFRVCEAHPIPVLDEALLNVCVHNHNFSVSFSEAQLIPSRRNIAERWLLKKAYGAPCNEFF